MAAKITIPLELTTKKAINGVKRFSKTASSSLKAVESSIFSVKGAIAAVTGVLAGRAIIQAGSAVTQAASVQEDAINNLNNALARSGEFSAEASQDMQDFASSIQQVTKFGDEAILQQLSLAKAFGASNEQAKEVTQAAVELAAATGKSLEEATRQVSKTLGGYAGELGEVSPQIKALTAEQLRAGEAAKVLVALYGGAAAAQVNTFSGALQQASNTFHDLQEEIGFTITQNPVVIRAIKLLNEGFQRLIKIVNDNRDEIGAFIGKAIKALVSQLPRVVDFVSFVAKAFQGLLTAIDSVTIAFILFAKAALQIDIVSAIVENAVLIFKAFEAAALDAFNTVISLFGKFLEFTGRFNASFQGAAAIAKTFTAAIEDRIREVGEEAADSLIDTDKLKTNLDGIEKAALDSAEKTNANFAKIQDGLSGVREEAVKTANAVQGIGTDLKPTGAPKQGPAQADASLASEKLLDGAEKAAGFIAAGADGAKKAVEEGAVKALETFAGPGVGEALRPLLAAFTEGPEFVRNITEGFIDALPEVLVGFADGAGVFVEVLAEKSDEIIVALIKATPKVALSLAKAMPRVAIALAESVRDLLTGKAFSVEFQPDKLQMIFDDFTNDFKTQLQNLPEDISNELISSVRFLSEDVAVSIRDSIRLAAPEQFRAMRDGAFLGIEQGSEKLFGGLQVEFDRLVISIKNAFTPFSTGLRDLLLNLFPNQLATVFNGFLDTFRDIVKKISSSLSIGGGGGGIGGFIETATGGRVRNPFQAGGLVPSGFNNDTFPANLSSGELVIPRDDVMELRRFLSRQQTGGTSMEETNSILAGIASLIRDGGGVNRLEVDEDGLANAILTLNRQNERLTA